MSSSEMSWNCFATNLVCGTRTPIKVSPAPYCPSPVLKNLPRNSESPGLLMCFSSSARTLSSIIYPYYQVESRIRGNLCYTWRAMTYVRKISQLPAVDRPREKLQKRGESSLSDFELLEVV